MTIRTLLDACVLTLSEVGELQSAAMIASKLEEMRLWHASEHDVSAAILSYIGELEPSSRFVAVGEERSRSVNRACRI